MNIFDEVLQFHIKKDMGLYNLTDEFFCVLIKGFLEKEKKNILLVVDSLFEANKLYNSMINYDENVLKYTKYPYKLKSRIAGPNGHLSNKVAGQTINYLINSGLKKAVLGHLSKESNFPELAYQTVIDELISNGTNTDNFSLSVADRNKPGKLIQI